MEEMYCEALKIALEFERENQEFYSQKINEVKSPLAKKALEFLIREDSRHIDTIIRFNRSLFGEEVFDQEKECSTELPEKVKELFKTIIDLSTSAISVDDSDIQIYEKAMELENKGYKMYKLYSESKELDHRVRKFFSFLAEEESNHYDLLAKTKKYLEDPSYYFEEEGGWIFG